MGVLAGQRRDYGSAILKLAEQTLRPAPPMAIGVVRSGSQITHRMRRILDPQLPTGRTLSWSALALVLIAAATLLPAGPRQRVLTQDPQEADAGIKPVEFRIVPATLPQAKASIRWLPIRQRNVSIKDRGLSPSIPHARQVDGRWEAPVWDVAEHALLASDKWHVVHSDAKPDTENSTFWTVTITLDEQGGHAFRALSLQHHKQHLAIIVNGGIITAPTINGEMGSSLEITGAFTKETTQALADAISQPAQKPEAKARTVKAVAVTPAGTTFKGGVGFDYRAYFLSREHRNDSHAKAAEFPAGPVTLTLDGVSPVRVRALEAGGGPIVGLKVYHWYLQKHDQPDMLNLSGLYERVSLTRDTAGEAFFDWIPNWQKQEMAFWPESEDHFHQRGSYHPEKGDGTLTMTLDRLVPLRGKATHADGSPAAGVEISAGGEGYQSDGFQGNTKTDAAGRYELRVAPHMIYLVLAEGEKLAAIPETGFAIWPGQPIENLDFTMRPATRLHGRITEGAEKTPVKQFDITVYQYGLDSLVLDEIKLPNPTGENRHVRPTLFHHATTDDTGYYEMFVGRGEFNMRGPTQNEIPKFEIKDEAEREFNFDSPRQVLPRQVPPRQD